MGVGIGGGWGAGGRSGGLEAPPINFASIIAKLCRHFGQTKAHWLEHGTLQDWQTIYLPELNENPPPETFLAGYFGYEPPPWPGAETPPSIFIEETLPEYED